MISTPRMHPKGVKCTARRAPRLDTEQRWLVEHIPIHPRIVTFQHYKIVNRNLVADTHAQFELDHTLAEYRLKQAQQTALHFRMLSCP
jgi:hypothetical protein